MRYILVFLLLVSSLLADRDGGPYLGIGYGYGDYDDDGFDKVIVEDSSQSLTLYAGAYINKHLSVEFAYVNFDSYQKGSGYLVTDNSDKEKHFSFSVRSISTLAHYAFFDDALDFYARFGAGEMRSTRSSDAGFSMVYGAGVSYRISEMFSLKLAYDLYDFGYDEDYDDSDDYKMRMDYIYTAFEVQF